MRLGALPAREYTHYTPVESVYSCIIEGVLTPHHVISIAS